MSKKSIKITAIIIAIIFLLGVAGPLAYILASAEPSDEITVLRNSINETEKELALIDAELAAAEEVEKKFLDESGQRLKVLFEKGMVSYIDIVLSAESVSDFTDRIVIAKELMEYDRNITNALGQIKKDINNKKVNAENLLKQQKEAENKLANLIDDTE